MGSILPSFKKILIEFTNEITTAGNGNYTTRNKYKKNIKWQTLLVKGWKYANNFSESDLEKVLSKKIDPAFEITNANLSGKYGFFDSRTGMLLDRDRKNYITHTRIILVFPDVFHVDDESLFDFLHRDLINHISPNLDINAKVFSIFEKTTNVSNRLKQLDKDFHNATDYSGEIIESGLENGRYVRIHGPSVAGKRIAVNKYLKNLNPSISQNKLYIDFK